MYAKIAYQVGAVNACYAGICSLNEQQDCATHKNFGEANVRSAFSDGEYKVTTIDFGRETTRNSGFATTPGMMGSLKTFMARRSAERQLRQLDDRLLSDIGLKRVDISKSVWGR
jgi:uncharacterized protein YjiS (DUF1127 family)